MYFPYLRGRQFELIALRELAEKNLIGNKIIPIVEPIKPTSTLLKTLSSYISNDRKLALVFNPAVGDFVKRIKVLSNEEKEKGIEGIANTIKVYLNDDNIIKSYIMDNNITEKLLNKKGKEKYLIINTKRDSLDAYLKVYDNCYPKYSLIPDDRAFRRLIPESKILFDDYFTKQIRNVDYIKNQDEFFSDIHLNFIEEDYTGFSDYSIVGQDFNESGFAPLAVAIHIVYFNEEKELRVRHFVSDSNEDINDPAGKFGEALEKLVLWCDENSIARTDGLNSFYDCHESGKYPGLGTVKKFSIMHHIELMNKFLEGEI